MKVKKLKELIEFLADSTNLNFYNVVEKSYTPIKFLIRNRETNKFSLCSDYFLHYADKELFEVIKLKK